MRFGMFLLAVGLALLPPGAARAQLGNADSNTPINIQADSGIEWQQNQQLYIARGNAVATRGPAAIKADTLIGHYRQVNPGAAFPPRPMPAIPKTTPRSIASRPTATSSSPATTARWSATGPITTSTRGSASSAARR